MQSETTGIGATDQKNAHHSNDLAKELGDVIDLLGSTMELSTRRARQSVMDAARAGASSAEDFARAHPIETCAAALVVGALAGVVATSGSSRRSYDGMAGAWAWPTAWVPAGVSGVTDRVARRVSETAAPVMPAVERAVEALADLNRQGTNPINHIASLWRSFRSGIEEAKRS